MIITNLTVSELTYCMNTPNLQGSAIFIDASQSNLAGLFVCVMCVCARQQSCKLSLKRVLSYRS